MDTAKQPFDWEGTLTETYQDLSQQLVNNLPLLAGALMLLVFGWLIAYLLKLVTRKLFRWIDAVCVRAMQRSGSQYPMLSRYESMSGSIVFWAVLLFFVAASANLLGLRIFSGIATTFIDYLPNVLTGLLIIVTGFALSGFARSAVSAMAHSTGITEPEILGRISQVIVILTALVIGIEQLGINVTFFTTTLIVITGVLLGGAALAFGLGARYFVANVIAAQGIRKHFQTGQLVRVGDIEGLVLEITSTTIFLETEKGKASIPARFFHEEITEFMATSPEGEFVHGNRDDHETE